MYDLDNAKLGKTSLEEMIREEDCCDVFVCGIATDVCVGKLMGWLVAGGVLILLDVPLGQPPQPITPMSWASGPS